VRCVLICNPASGRKRKRRGNQIQKIADALTALGHQVEIAATTAPGSATIEARRAVRDGAQIVFACGGDGTAHEVMQGLVSQSVEHNTSLGVIPLGSANALARHIGLSLDPVKAALQQIDATPHRIPIGKLAYGAQTRYFAVMAGAGPDGALVYNLLATEKASLGRVAYYLRAARLFATRRFGAFEVEYVEAESGATFTTQAVSVMAVRVGSLGGLFNKLVGRSVSIFDEKLQLIMLGPPALFSLPLSFITGWLRLHSFNRFLRSVRVTRFSCRPLSGAAPHFQADGEWLGRIPVDVSIIQDSVRILIPHEHERPESPAGAAP
jgi:diacylglycerol kinase family enzyme